jgi:beta-lactamase regulating signal transducer with metallopeptidase domain/tetratricopeptide (TPR) repeat protein
MNSFDETLNQFGQSFLGFAWPMLGQSSLLIAVVFAFDFLFRRKLRASIRYALWLVVLVKLCMPPTLALPTSPAWWLHQAPPPVVAKPETHYTVTYDSTPMPKIPQTPLPAYVPPKPAMNLTAGLFLISAAVSLALLGWLLARWWQIAQQVRHAKTSERLDVLADEAQKMTSTKFKMRAWLTTNTMSPAVCGLFWPVILIPQSLAEHFSDEQLRAVLLHELIHLRRRDVWVNFLQALVQIVYWWHPLVWVANARIRRVREEAVDDAVMLALRDESEAYAPTLLKVAKLILNRPPVSLGLVGIMESRHALRQRIERLVDFRPPRRAGLTLVSLLGILAFTAVAVPMGEGPGPRETSAVPGSSIPAPTVAAQSTNPHTTTWPGILSNSNFSVVLHALQQRQGFERLVEPEVQNSSGHGINSITIANLSVPVSTKSAEQLVKDGKLLYEMGKLDEAEAKFKSALGQDSNNPVAKYYLGLVQTMRLNPNHSRIKSGRQMIVEKLYRIRLPQVSFTQLSLEEVVRELNEATLRNDSEKIGIQILIATNSVSGRLANINSVVVNLAPLTYMRLSDVLDAVVLTADKPIQYSILDDGIVFSEKSQTDTADINKLYTRTFRVNPNIFYSKIEKNGADLDETTNKFYSNMGITGVDFGETTISPASTAQKIFAGLGLDLQSPKGKSIFYGDRLGILYVKATASDLDTIERALVALNSTAPQLHIKASFVEAPKGTTAGFKKYFNFTNESDGRLVGILSSENAKMAIPNLQAQAGFNDLAEPEATSLSGRQTQMRATQIINVVTNVVFEESYTNQTGFIISNTIVPQTTRFETGPVLDVVPYVLADGYTINLALIPSMTEFLGYDTPTNTTTAYNRAGEKIDVPKVSPHFTVRQVVATVNLWDGQTALLGGIPETNHVSGSVVTGNLKTSDKELLIFITATIVDPAGNRVHTDNDLPFAQKGVPPQPK